MMWLHIGIHNYCVLGIVGEVRHSYSRTRRGGKQVGWLKFFITIFLY